MTAIAQDVIDARVQQWQLQQLQAQQAQQAGRRSPWGSLRGGGILGPQQAQQAGRRSPWGSLRGGGILGPQQAQQSEAQQRVRARSADSYGGQQLPLDASVLGSRGRSGRHADSSSSMRSMSADRTGREYVVRGSELGSQPGRDDEPSCCIS